MVYRSDINYFSVFFTSWYFSAVMFLKVGLLSFELHSCTSYQSWYIWHCLFSLPGNTILEVGHNECTFKFAILYHHISFGSKEYYSILLLFIRWLKMSLTQSFEFIYFGQPDRLRNEFKSQKFVIAIANNVHSVFFRQLVSCSSETHLQHRWPHDLIYTHQHVTMSIAKAWTLYWPLGTIFNDLYSFTQKTPQMDFIWTTLQLPVWVPSVPVDCSPLTIRGLGMFK
jgi:hypothetical protein